MLNLSLACENAEPATLSRSAPEPLGAPVPEWEGLRLERPLVSVPDGLVRQGGQLWYHFQRFSWTLERPEANPRSGEAFRHLQWRLAEPLPTESIARRLPGAYHWGMHPHLNSLYHFFCDLLPHLLSHPRQPVLIRPDWPQEFERFLSDCGWQTRRLEVGTWQPDELWIPGHSALDWEEGKVRQLQHFLQQCVPVSPQPEPAVRLYLSRRKARRRHLLNEAALELLWDRFRLQTVCLEDLPMEEQVRLMRRAQWVIAPHGAGLVQVLSAPSACRILEIRPVCKSGGGCFERLFRLGWPRHEVLVPPKRPDFTCPPELLERILTRWEVEG